MTDLSSVSRTLLLHSRSDLEPDLTPRNPENALDLILIPSPPSFAASRDRARAIARKTRRDPASSTYNEPACVPTLGVNGTGTANKVRQKKYFEGS
ncbi:hypothetical protein JHW43_006635 [Diplocarpon mali]|nr:hypothetical protein JHW43_006635 [Diplocarpon mali]